MIVAMRMYLNYYTLVALILSLAALPAQSQVTLTSISEEFSTSEISGLNVRVYDADVSVLTSDGSNVNVEVTVEGNTRRQAREYFEKQKISVNLKEDTLWVRSKRERPYGTSSDWRKSADIQVTIHIPTYIPTSIRTSDGNLEIEELTAGVSLRTSDGDIQIGSISGDEISIHTSDGDVDADYLSGSTSVSIRTSDGDLSFGALSGDQMNLRTSDGDIEIELVEGNFSAISSDGDLRISEMISSNAEVRTSDGDITIDEVNGSLALRNIDGDVELGIVNPESVQVSISDGDAILSMPNDLPATFDISARDVDMDSFSDFSGEITNTKANGDLNGGGALIQVRTSDGEVVMERLN